MPNPKQRRRESLAARDDRGVLERILDIPGIAQIVPQLPPELLHRVIQTYGLEDTAGLVAMATPAQLQRVFDIDLWRPPRAGFDEQFDAARFATWLGVLMESGADVAAHKVAGMDAELIIAALAQHLRVFDTAAVTPYEIDDGELFDPRHSQGGAESEVGGYLIEAKREDGWESMVSLLAALDADYPDYFARVMRGCCRLSNNGREIDGLDGLLGERQQAMFDVTLDREHRREKSGYVTPAHARAFLQSARQLQLSAPAAPPVNPVAGAYFRAIEHATPEEQATQRDPVNPDVESPGVAAIVDVLLDAGVIAPPPRALLEAPRDDSADSRMRRHMQAIASGNPLAYETRTEELAYLANTLVAGGSIEARPFTEREASDAVIAVCNLGLENWPRQWLRRPSGESTAIDLPDSFLAKQDLIGVFQVGWKVLYSEVCLYTSNRLLDLLSNLRVSDFAVQSDLRDLRLDLMKNLHAGTPWVARHSFEVLAILDTPAWVALLRLVDECPVMHGVVSATADSSARAINPTAFEFISENRQIASIQQFVGRLPEILQG